MRPRGRLAVALGLWTLAAVAQAAPVLMISVDGLRPGDVIEAKQRGVKAPILSGLLETGLYASGVRNALPTVTYPNHTTLVTGVWPARHGVANNETFDPLGKNLGGWFWYARDIKVRTLWDAARQSGRTSASFSWPATVGDASIDYLIPEYWRARTADDLKLLRALSTQGLVDSLEAKTGVPFANAVGASLQADEGRALYAAAVIAMKHPTLTTIHLVTLDHDEHGFGPGSPRAYATLAALDGIIGRLIASARRAEPDLVVAIVSDHGFAAVQHDVNLTGYFVDAGLITLDPATHKPAAWDAALWGGASVAVVLSRPEDPALKAKVGALLTRLAAMPELGIDRVANAGEIAAMGGTPQAAYWVDFKPGYQLSPDPLSAPVSPGTIRGTHGYFPSHPEMRASFVLSGPGVPRRGSLGEIDMRDIAPTLAKILHVALPEADGKPLF
jgi:predicted AlkP superfamily pyrophosphatase or phosphodiesterase